MERQIIFIIHNVRSCHNVGSLLRTAEGLGINKVYITGYTPHPGVVNDARLPHIVAGVTSKIAKTALGAEKLVNWQQQADVAKVMTELKNDGYKISALEQTPWAQPLYRFQPPAKTAIIVGNEVHGLEQTVLDLTDHHIMIPMLGKKESFNVVQAAAMSLYYVRFYQSN